MAQHTIMVKATSLGDAGGRIDYISNPNRQEYLEAVYYSTDDETFWAALAAYCQEQAKYSQTKNAVEAREWVVPLANELFEMYDPATLVRMASDRIKAKTGTENVVAVHWNKAKNNYHIHVISAENKEINQVKEGAVLTRNTYFDENGKRSSKKNCVDQNGVLKPGCTFYKKGEQKIDQIRFGPKIEEIGSRGFLQELKRDVASWQNQLLHEERFRVFDPSLYIAEQHVGKGTPNDLQASIEARNGLVRAYNQAVDQCLALANLIGQKQRELDYWHLARKTIKKHARTTSWENAISWYVERFNSRIQWLQSQVVEKQPEKAVDAPERKISLLDQIAAADTVRASQGAGKRKTPGGDNHGDDWDYR